MFAARILDFHVCPKTNKLPPPAPPIPHVGGPILGKKVKKTKIGGMYAAVKGDKCLCVGPPDEITGGSSSVKIEGKKAARMGDKTDHGGKIVLGCFTVWIGG